MHKGGVAKELSGGAVDARCLCNMSGMGGAHVTSPVGEIPTHPAAGMIPDKVHRSDRAACRTLMATNCMAARWQLVQLFSAGFTQEVESTSVRSPPAGGAPDVRQHAPRVPGDGAPSASSCAYSRRILCLCVHVRPLPPSASYY